MRHQQERAGSTDEIESAAYISALMLAIDHFGIDAFSTTVADLAQRAMHIAPEAARVLIVPTQTLAARERAFAELSRALMARLARTGGGD